MSGALVQSILGTNGSNSWTIAGANKTVPVTGSFGSTTGAGNLLVAIGFYTQGRLTGTSLPPTSWFTPVTSGITWLNTFNGLINTTFTQSDGSGFLHRQGVAMWIAGNAPSISAGTVTTVTLSITAALGTSSGGATAEFSLYEFSGLVASSSIGVGGALIDTDAALGNQTGGAPATANLSTTVPDTVIAAFTGNSANDTAGAGYTLGQTCVGATTGQVQYRTGVASGSISTAFTGAQGNWGAISIAFKEAAGGGARSRAYFFG